MQVSSIRLKQFRSYDDSEFSFDEKLTLITGKNGVGKTNLLEAIYVLLQGGSFRVSDTELTKFSTEWWRIDGVIDGEVRQVRFQLDKHPPKSIIENETAKRFSYRHKLPVVLFEPNDLLLVHGSPTRRRDTLDNMLRTLSEPYKKTLAKFERALKQRNTLLKNKPNIGRDDLFVWDVAISEYASEIVNARVAMISQINQSIGAYYSHIANREQSLILKYETKLPKKVTTSVVMSALHKTFELDKIRATTSIGPHRDDLSFWLDNSLIKTTASRGEIRTLILAMKLSYAKIMEETYGTKPVLLLDDVFSELDEKRKQSLTDVMEGYQVIITDTAKHLAQHRISL